MLSMNDLAKRLTKEQRGYINELWHISRVESRQTYDRHNYVLRWFLKKYPDFWVNYPTGLMKLIERETYWLKT